MYIYQTLFDISYAITAFSEVDKKIYQPEKSDVDRGQYMFWAPLLSQFDFFSWISQKQFIFRYNNNARFTYLTCLDGLQRKTTDLTQRDLNVSFENEI